MKFLARMCAALVLLLLAQLAFAQDQNLKAATEAAQQWLTIVDSGHYGQSWDEAASFFQEKVSKQDWERAADQVRSPLGKMQTREIRNASYQTKLPGAPEGKYFVLQYRTKFASAQPMIETVTPMLDKDGKWKVSGYFIKPAD